jgi:tape measure domain-containing protein
MGYDGSLKFDTEINESGFNSGISKLGGIAKKGAGVAVAAVGAVTAALGAGVVAGVKYNASIESYQTSFEVMTGSAEKAAEVIDKLKKVGAETPFELPDLADTTQLLMNYGFSADEAMDKMMMLGDISQGSAEKMSRIATAYGQMSSAGKVSLEDVKQMIEAGFNPLQEISESTGESMASLYDRISKGTISVDEITASMQRATSEGGKYFQSMEKQSQTFSGLISTLKDNAQQLLGEVVKPISDGLTESLLPAAISAIEQLTQGFEENGVAGMIQAAGNIVNGLFTGMMENAPLLISTGMELLNQFLLGIATSIPELLTKGFEIVTQLALGIIQNLPQLISQGSQVITNFVSGVLSSLPSVLQSGADMILNLLHGLVQSAPQIITQAGIMIADFASAIGERLPDILQKGIEIIGQLLAGIIEEVPKLLASIPGIIADIGSAFLDKDWGEIGLNIIKGIATGVKNAAGELVDAAVNAAENALNWVKDKLGIRSPSRVFRDQVGKNMALGIGVGFEDNIPYKDMEKQANRMVSRIQGAAIGVTTSASPTAGGYIASRSAIRTSDNSELIYAVEKLSRLANRPIELINKIDSVQTSRVLATPMQNQIQKNQNFRKMLGGDRD